MFLQQDHLVGLLLQQATLHGIHGHVQQQHPYSSIGGENMEVGNKTRSSFDTGYSNDSPPPLMVTLTPFGYMAPRSKGMCTLQRYIEFLHSLPSAFPPTLTLYHIYIYRH
jgi:hypothetical protein